MSIKLNGNNIAGYVKDKNLKESIIPLTSNELDLGNSNKYFKNAYINNLLLGNNTLKSNGTNITLTNDDNEYTLYHTGNKPSALDVGAVPLTGNNENTAITGIMYIRNYIKYSYESMDKEINIAGVNPDSNALILGGGKDNTGGIILDTNGGSTSVKINDSANNLLYTVYHTGNKPSASDVGAVPLSGNTKDSPITGNVYIQNYVKWIDSTNNKEINMIGFNETSKESIYGGGNNTGGVTFDTAGGSDSIKVWDAVNGKSYKVYHTGNAPKALWSAGDKTAETGTEAPVSGHMAMNTIYDNGYPCSYGNLLTLSGAGKAELAMEWTGNDTPTTGRLYYRSKRDTGGVAWGAWKKIAYTDDTINKANIAFALEYCARSADTGTTNTNKYFKLASYTITENYGSASAEYNVGFYGHAQASSPRHRLGVWIKRQDSTFTMDLKVWGALNDSFVTYSLVRTGQYQATLYAYIRTQYCRLYMSCASRFYNSASTQYYDEATPIDSVGSTIVYGTYMDKPSAIGANTTIFAGIINASAIAETYLNMNSCVSSLGKISSLSSGTIYKLSGMVHNKKNLYLYNDADKSQKFTLLNESGLTLGSNDYIPFCRTIKMNNDTTWFLADENQARPDWTQITIEKISGGN